jgi:uncharacterized membrane protein YqjE
MHDTLRASSNLAGSAKSFGRRLLALGANRLELVEVELKEARNEAIGSLFLILGAAALAFLAAFALSAAIVVALWSVSPLGALLGLAALYGAGAFCLYSTVAARQRRWKLLPETLEQLRQDRACVEKLFS